MKKTLKVLFLFVVVGLAACSKSKDDKPAPKYEDFVDSKMEAALVKMGVSINKGNNPPIVQGDYIIDPFKCTNSNFADGLKGSEFGKATLKLFNQNNNINSIDFKNKIEYTASMIAKYGTITEDWDGNGCFISGEGNKFSIFFHSEGSLVSGGTKSQYKNLIVLSGEIDKNTTINKILGIKDLQMVSLMADDYGDPNNKLVENGQGRLFTNSYAKVK